MQIWRLYKQRSASHFIHESGLTKLWKSAAKQVLKSQQELAYSMDSCHDDSQGEHSIAYSLLCKTETLYVQTLNLAPMSCLIGPRALPSFSESPCVWKKRAPICLSRQQYIQISLWLHQVPANSWKEEEELPRKFIVFVAAQEQDLADLIGSTDNVLGITDTLLRAALGSRLHTETKVWNCPNPWQIFLHHDVAEHSKLPP